MIGQRNFAPAVLSLFALAFATVPAAAADGDPWHVQKLSGDVWLTGDASQLVSLTKDTVLGPGNSIRTGQDGRVLLTRGEERILISPNSAIAIPSDQEKHGMPTTITQQAGTISLEVEKGNVQHFEVETPYLAAVVKGTQFQVSVGKGSSKVEVLRGQVQVSDFKTGDNVLVLPGQSVSTSSLARGGLILRGRGQFNPIQHGTPRSSTVKALAVPPTGLRAPHVNPGQETRPLRAASRFNNTSKSAANSKISHMPNGKFRIGAALGEVRLDFHKVTQGLAHGSLASNGASGTPGSSRDKSGTHGEAADAYASAGGLNSNASSNGGFSGNGNGSGGLGGNGNTNGNGGGNGGGNGNGSGVGAAGNNGLALGLGNGNGLALGGSNGNGKAKGKK